MLSLKIDPSAWRRRWRAEAAVLALAGAWPASPKGPPPQRRGGAAVCTLISTTITHAEKGRTQLFAGPNSLFAAALSLRCSISCRGGPAESVCRADCFGSGKTTAKTSRWLLMGANESETCGGLEIQWTTTAMEEEEEKCKNRKKKGGLQLMCTCYIGREI